MRIEVVDAEVASVTFDQFVKLPDPPSGHLELHHGRVVLVPVRLHSHAVMQSTICDLLLPLTRGNGFMTAECGFRASPDEFWQADVGFVRTERINAGADYQVGAPDLVIEVLAPGETLSDINDKIEVCTANGCVSFWVVDPKRETVSVTEGDVTRQYRASMLIPLPPPLEGTIPVSAIFERAA